MLAFRETPSSLSKKLFHLEYCGKYLMLSLHQPYWLFLHNRGSMTEEQRKVQLIYLLSGMHNFNYYFICCFQPQKRSPLIRRLVARLEQELMLGLMIPIDNISMTYFPISSQCGQQQVLTFGPLKAGVDPLFYT